MALHRLRLGGTVRVVALLTSFVQSPDRVGVHEVEAELIRRQARSLGLPLIEAFHPSGAPNAQYEAAIACALAQRAPRGVEVLAFGDLFLEDIRAYRDALAARLGVRSLYPVWREPTVDFAQAVIAAGFKAIVCSVDTSRMPLSAAGRSYDQAFLSDLPPGVDPCGENGEFHTFVYDGPGFQRPIPVARGAPERRGGLGVCPLSIA